MASQVTSWQLSLLLPRAGEHYVKMLNSEAASTVHYP